ncbi:extracellular solute-binding protein family 1 [Beutenbergia cavernae DSM 12333]|uniref:Extracellular solute-binding protein family 1 n=1 Tax=Beutenbergia cavernae (strain ATCC BAA-8 / DSM 12333 / CCUG 43141 / JCM 11478 / NBRC 16432 / NCIMB 13614 / HKI 0122) TaxID=471853 RepID=C5C2K9_BEUC1|nr:extracellular solute-binding protein [Beutenbergia cavernae]ACQ79695.1 extracellular solute-binding protein family 1 [Beutenbergia cavernae DSM 12333]
MRLELDRRTMLQAGALALGGTALAACSSGGGGSAGGGGGGASGAPATLPTFRLWEGPAPDFAGAADGGMDGFRAFPAEPARAIDDVPGDGEPITFMTNIPGAIPPTREANSFWRAVEERIGSPLDISMSSNDEYEDKFATRVAGDDLPDLINVPPNVPQLPALLAAKALDLTEHLAGDAVLDYPFLANLPTESWKGCLQGGGIYGVPVPRGLARTSLPIYRRDLVEAAGISDPQPTSFEEFLDLCREMTDPARNTWAWASVPTNYLRQMWSCPYLWAVDDDGRFTAMWELEECEAALADAVTMFEAGVVNPDAFTANVGAQKQWFAAGTAVFVLDSYVAWNQFYTDNPTLTEMRVDMLDVPGRDGGAGTPWLGLANNNITAFNANTEHDVETLLAVANWMAAPFGTDEYKFRKFGVEGEHHELQGTDPVVTPLGTTELGIGLQYIADAPMTLYLPGRPEVPEAQFASQQAVLDRLVADASWGLYSETSSRVNKQIQDTINDVTNQIIQGNAAISTWPDAVQAWLDGGGEQIRGELEEAYAEQNG